MSSSSNDSLLSLCYKNKPAEPLELMRSSSPKTLRSLISYRDANRSTPLHYASCNGLLAVVKELVKHNASINAATTIGYTPLHYASWNGHSEVAEFLIASRSRLNTGTCSDRSTPLHFASLTGSHEVVELLLSAGADQTKRTKDGKTALEIAERKKLQKVIDVFSNPVSEAQKSAFQERMKLLWTEIQKKDQGKIREICNKKKGKIFSVARQQTDAQVDQSHNASASSSSQVTDDLPVLKPESSSSSASPSLPQPQMSRAYVSSTSSSQAFIPAVSRNKRFSTNNLHLNCTLFSLLLPTLHDVLNPDTSSISAVSSSSSASSSLPQSLQDLINYIYEETVSTITSKIDVRITAKGLETPLGIPTAQQIQQGEYALQKIHQELFNPQPKPETFKQLTSEYFTRIPHRIRSAAALRESIIDRMEKYSAEMDLIQLMKDMLQVDSLKEGESAKAHECVFHTNNVDAKYQALGTKITPLDPNSKEYQDLLLYFRKTESNGIGKWAHEGKIPEQIPLPKGILIKIYEVYNEYARANYNNSVGNEHLLYHGSRHCNFVGLISRGLMMPDAVTAMGIPRTDFGWLGAGIYFGDCFNTVAQSCVTSGKSRQSKTRLMLVCRVSLGKWGEQTKRDGKIRAPHPGCDSLHGNPHLKPTQFDVDQYAVYQQNRQYTAYLVEF